MAISKKPFLNQGISKNKITEEEIDNLIRKGGSPASTGTSNGHGNGVPKIKLVQLRLPEDILTNIDSIRNNYKGYPKPSRHSWIMDAIISKIEENK